MTSATCKLNSSFPLKPLAAAVLLVFSANVQTAPILDGVLGNNLDLNVSLPGTTVITQTVNQRDVIRWQEFSIGSGETVRFVQPGADSVILNRVVGGNSSEIFGSLVANGRIFLINPSGIVFGAGSQVNVGSLVASTLNLKGNGNGNGQMPGQTIAFETGANAGGILNAGSITAKDIVFLAPSITNSGNLTAGLQPQHQAGSGVSVNLIAAKEVTVNTSGSDLVVQAVEGHNNALIQQLGQVLAEGGRIILLANASNNGDPSVINTAGVNQASRISIEGDLIQLTGSLNVGNPQGTVDVIAGEVGQMQNGQSAALLSDGGLNINSRGGLSLNNAGNDFTGSVDLTATGSVAVHDSNNLQVSVDSGGEATLSAQNLAIRSLASDGLTVNASGRIEQTGPVQVNGSTVLNANEINLGNQANQFDGEVLINSTAGTTLHTNGELDISGSAAQLNLTAAEITQSAALSVAGLSALNANQVNLLESDNDFAGNVELAVTGAATLIDMNDLAVSGSAGAATLSAVNQVQLNELTVESLNVTAASIAQNGTLTVQQGTSLNASAVQLADTSNDFGGNVELGNVGTAELADEGELSLSGQVNNLTATARNTTQSAQAGPLTVNNTATFNGENVELIQLGNTFRGQVVLNLDGQVQLGSAEGIAVSGRAASAVFNVDSIRQGTTEADALNVLGQTRINNSNSVRLNNATNRFGSTVVLQNAGSVNLNGNDTLTVQGSADDVALTTGSNGQIVVNGLNANSLSATATRIDQTDFLNVTGTSALSAQHIDLTESGNNQFGSTVTLASSESAAIKANGTLTVAGNVASGSVEADSLVFNGLTVSNGLAMSADSITQSMDVDRALQVQGETRINNSGAVALNNAMNDFNGDVVLNTQGSVRLRDSNTLTIEGQAGSLDLTALSIAQSDSLVVGATAALNAAAVSLNNLANDFQGQVNLLGNARVSLRDENTLNVAGNAQELVLNANTVEISNALTVNENLTLTSDIVTQASSGAAALMVGGDARIEHRNNSSNTLVRLNNANNDFVGPVTLSNQVNVELADRNTLTVQGQAGRLSVNATEVNQLGDLTVENQATLNANTISFMNAANNFAGPVVLNSAGSVNLRDQQVIELQGSAGSLNVQAGTAINQSGALNVNGNSNLAAPTINLTNAANSFGGGVTVNATQQATVNASGDLSVGGNAAALTVTAQNELDLSNSMLGSLNAAAQQIGQSAAVSVTGPTVLVAQGATLLDEGNDFNGTVILNVAGQASIADTNNLLIQGTAQTLTTSVVGTLTAGDLSIANGTLIAGEINVNQLEVANSAELQAGKVTQTQASQTGGSLTLRANEVDLAQSGNDFSGQIILQNVGTATISDINDLVLSGQVQALAADAQRITQQQSQPGALNVQGRADLRAANIDLQNAANNFGGVVGLQVSDTAQLRDVNNLVLQGDVGTLNVRASQLAQASSLTVRNNATIEAAAVDLNHQANDFQGRLSLNVAGDAQVADTNSLRVAGNVNTATMNASTLIVDGLAAQGNVTFNAASTGQSGVLSVAGASTFNGDSIALDNQANSFSDVVHLNLTGAASITASGGLNVSGTATSVNASANSLSVSSLASENIVLQADQLELNNFSATGNLTLNGGNVIQQGALQVGGTTTLGASNVTLQDEANNFVGNVVLNSAGSVNLRDQQVIALQGSAGSLNVQAGTAINQSGALNVSGNSNLAAPTINLTNAANSFGGGVTVNATQQATVNASGDLLLGGNAAALTVTAQNELDLSNSVLGSLNATAQHITQIGELLVTGATELTAQAVDLRNEHNNFSGPVTLDVAVQTDISDNNDLLLQGQSQILNTSVVGTLTAGELSIANGTLIAGEINVNQLEVANSAELQAGKVTQTQASQTVGSLTLRANEVDLAQAGNDFSGQIILQNVGTATISDTNDLALSGRVNALIVNAQRITQQQSQPGALNVQGRADLRAANIDLQNAANNFGGVVDLQVSDTAQLRDVNNLVLQGDVGTLNVRASQLAQAGSLTVRNNATIEAAAVDLNHQANDFQGNVALNVSGTTVVADANVLNVSGQLNGAAELRALSIEQDGTLTANSSVLLQANHVDLGNQGNSFNSLLRVEDASQATLSSAGTLRVQGANLGTLNLQAQEVSLGELGELQQLDIAAAEVRQTAALNVKGDTNLRSDRVDLNNSENDFIGKITVQNPDSANASVSITDKNDLSMQGENLALAARVLGNFELQANNVELGSMQVDGASQIELTGALTQSRSVMLNDASLTAAQISLTNSGNRFNGNTQVQSGGSVALGTSGNLNVNTTSSTGTLALNVGGNAEVSGMQVQFADSQFDGELAVSANQISQVGRLQVGGDARLESIGGEIDLQHADNRFRGTVSASAEQTRLSTLGDMQLLNLNSRGGQLTADGRMLLLGTIEQTGGALTFTAKGVSRPLSSADIALVLPPSLDVFSSKEAVNPFTGLGRITVASPMIHQRSGQLLTTAGATTQFNSPENGSIVLTQNNQINGQVGVLAGRSHNQSFSYVPDRGASLFAVNNDVRLNIGGQGAEADLIAVRARGLATQGSDAVIRARMPYNDLAVGTARSYAGLTLSIPLGGVNGQPGGLATFGESSGSGQSAGAGAIRVEVGDINRPGLGGFLTVLPFEGSNLLPGQVVYLAGPERKGTQAFFYDGARSLDRIPVVYNGTLLLSPQEAAALTTAQGAVVLARQEQTRSVVRTENVAGKIINGVVAEVGPGRPATEGEGGATKPATCDAEDSGLSCAP
jgi:filamentous hemagglutinin family protein